MSLELCAAHWLRWDRRCLAVLHERTPRHVAGLPDCLGITKSRYCIEVEIKRSLSDFRANADKPCIRARDLRLKHYPKEFWFLVPESLVLRISTDIPEWAGLAFMPAKRIHFSIAKQAPVNYDSQRLTLKECCQVFHKISNQLHSVTSWYETEGDYSI